MGNAAMCAMLEHLGFRLEGIMRAYGPMRDGTRRDGAMHAVIESDWIAKMLAHPRGTRSQKRERQPRSSAGVR